MRKLLLIPILAFFLTACGSTGEAMKLGPDTYTVSASKHVSGGVTATASALQAANKYCISLGQELLVSGIKERLHGALFISDVTFKCLTKGDPELARPAYRPAPDIIIENRK